MKLFKCLFFFILLGGDFSLKPVSLESNLLPYVGCDGRANLLFAADCPILMRRSPFSGEVSLAVVLMTLAIGIVNHSTKLPKPIDHMLMEIMQRGVKRNRYAYNTYNQINQT